MKRYLFVILILPVLFGCPQKTALHTLPETNIPNVTTSIFVDENNEAYVAGIFLDGNQKPCYWKNGTTEVLSDYNSEANAIWVLDRCVYVAGYYFNGAYFHAGYWKDGDFVEWDYSDSAIIPRDIFIVP